MISGWLQSNGLDRLNFVQAQLSFGLEQQAPFAGGAGQFGHATVKLVSPPVESNSCNAGSFRSFGNGDADQLGCVPISTVGNLARQGLVACTCRRQRSAGFVIDQLTINMFVAAANAQPRTVAATANLVAGAFGSPPALSIDYFLSAHDCVWVLVFGF